MVRILCIRKNRDEKGRIVDYILKKDNGEEFRTTSQQIKAEMTAGRYEFLNLKLDKAGRLVDKALPKQKVQNKQNVTGDKSDNKEKTAFIKELKQWVQNWKSKYSYSDAFVGIYKKEYFYNYEMSERIRAFFTRLIQEIEKQALEDSVVLYNPFEDNSCTDDEKVESSKLPVCVKKFYKETDASFEIIEALVELVDNPKIAKIGFVDDSSYTNWAYDYYMVTANYDTIKAYISGVLSLVEEFRECCEWEFEPETTGNELGEKFYTRYLIEADGHDVEFYEDKLVEYAADKLFSFYGRDKSKYTIDDFNWAIRNVCFKRLPYKDERIKSEEEERLYLLYSRAYMYLKTGVLLPLYIGEETQYETWDKMNDFKEQSQKQLFGDLMFRVLEKLM